LKGAGALSATMLIDSCAAPVWQRRNAPRIVVLGAGFAGLACASELTARGHSVTVLEARGRVGGRVHSQPFGPSEKNTEAGAELIGSNHPHWITLAERFRLQLLDVGDDVGLEAPIVMNGRRLAPQESEVLWHELDEVLQRMNALARSVNGDEPWLSENAAALDELSVADWIDAQELSDLTRHACHVQTTANNGVSTERQSLLAMLAQVQGGGVERYWSDSELYRCRGGNQRLAEALASTLNVSALHLNSPVASVERQGSGARVVCSAGRAFEADFVVVALPPNTWHRVRFEVADIALLAPHQGLSVKYVAGVRRRFWRERGLSQYSFTDTEAAITWDPTMGDDEGEDAALTIFASADAAQMSRARSGAARRANYERELDASFPGFSTESTTSRFYDWPAEKWTGGGYSFPAPGEVTTKLSLLREFHGPLLFAGEHTSSAFVGYMEGALESGVRVARRLDARTNA